MTKVTKVDETEDDGQDLRFNYAVQFNLVNGLAVMTNWSPDPGENPDEAAEIHRQITERNPLPEAASSAAHNPSIGAAIELVMEWHASRGVRPRTIEEYRDIYSLFAELVGRDKPVRMLQKEDIREYLRVLRQVPKNRRKNPKTRNLGVRDMLATAGVDRLSATSVKKHAVRIDSFLKWAYEQDLTKLIFPRGISRDMRKSRETGRRPWPMAQVRRLGQLLAANHDLASPSRYWVPMLSIFTGARMAEVAGIQVVDVRQDEGIWLLDLNEAGPRRLKNQNSLRKVPLHQKLIELGFIDFVQSQDRSGEIMVFPDVKALSGKYSHYLSRWFGRFRKSHGFQGLVFHELRNSMADELQAAGVEESVSQAILGHKNKGMTYGLYAGAYRLGQLKVAIDKTFAELGIDEFRPGTVAKANGR